jgi:hypothetical protein
MSSAIAEVGIAGQVEGLRGRQFPLQPGWQFNCIQPGDRCDLVRSVKAAPNQSEKEGIVDEAVALQQLNSREGPLVERSWGCGKGAEKAALHKRQARRERTSSSGYGGQ